MHSQQSVLKTKIVAQTTETICDKASKRR